MFLATTSLEEFWNTDSKIIFLGEWCKLHSRTGFLEELDYDDSKYIWDSVDKKEEAYDYCYELSERILKELTKKLNLIHEESYDEKYYKAILGAWLLRYLFQMYDKYLTLEEFISNNSEFETYVLDEKYYCIPLDYQDSMNMVGNDIYHLQQYSKILKSFDYKFSSKKPLVPMIQKVEYSKNNSIKSLFKRVFFNSQNLIIKLFKIQHIMMVNPHMNKTIINSIVLFFKSKFKITLNDFSYKINFKVSIDKALRKETIQLSDNHFEKMLSQIILSDLPIVFLEGYKNFKRQILFSTKNIGKIDLIYTANALYGNEIFKFYLAEFKLYDILLSHQHGNSYGVDRFVMGERYESSLSRIFYTWGWGNGKFKYLPSSKLGIQQNFKSSEYKIDILYVMTALPRYLYVLKPYIISSDFLFSYIKNSINFLELLTTGLTYSVVIREYFQDYHWDIKKRILKSNINNKNVLFNNKDNIYKQITSAKICVFDHFQTTALETLAMNKATIIFIDMDVYGYREETLPYYNQLIEVGILHTSPENAFAHIKKYTDILAWWQSPNVQKAREDFCYNYARGSENWVDEWIEEFDRVLEE